MNPICQTSITDRYRYSIASVMCNVFPLLRFVTSCFVSWNQSGKRKVCRCWEGYVVNVKDSRCVEAVPIYVSISCIVP